MLHVQLKIQYFTVALISVPLFFWVVLTVITFIKSNLFFLRRKAKDLYQCSPSCGHGIEQAEARVTVTVVRVPGKAMADVACGVWTNKGQGPLLNNKQVVFKLFLSFIIRTGQNLTEMLRVLASLFSVRFHLRLVLLFLPSSTYLFWAVCAPLHRAKDGSCDCLVWQPQR